MINQTVNIDVVELFSQLMANKLPRSQILIYVRVAVEINRKTREFCYHYYTLFSM